jgi:hypothetical protein
MKHELDIPRIEQEVTNWCWAACAQMTLGFTNNNQLTQEQIVAVMYDVPVSQVNANNPDCNSPASIKEIEIVFQEYAVYYKFLNSALTYSELIEELKTGPVEIGIRWGNGGMHAILAYGYNTNSKSVQEVLIRDPWKDTAPVVTVNYADLINGEYGGRSKGKWVDTFWKLRKVKK